MVTDTMNNIHRRESPMVTRSCVDFCSAEAIGCAAGTGLWYAFHATPQTLVSIRNAAIGEWHSALCAIYLIIHSHGYSRF
jgi:hypothetical protein